MVDFVNKPNYNINDLIELLKLLCSPDGCPWDAEQTHESIRRNLLEEAYEAAEAIDNNDTEALIEELGDVLLQVIFHADIAQRASRFDFNAITDATCKKLIRRHPHVFGEKKANDGTESLVFWEDVKREEKKHESATDSMRSVALSLPALWRAEKIQKKAAAVGFDRSDYSGLLESLRSELAELENAISSETGIMEELGDLLFSAVNLARFFKIDPEDALTLSSNKFIARFKKLEDCAAEAGKRLDDLSLEDIDAIYQKIKLEE